MDQNWIINPATCKACGNCVDVCPNRIIQKSESKRIEFRPDRLWMCFQCGHCMAVCPTQSISVSGLSYAADFYPLPPTAGDHYEHLIELFQSRRSVRNFQNRPVPHELLEKVVQAIRMAPPGFPPIKTELTVIADADLLRRALPIMIELYENLIKAMKNPIARQIIRRKAGCETFITLQNHLIPLLTNRLPDLKSGKEDTIMRRAPVLILLHANRECENYKTDIHIALAFGLLAAHSVGLGATALDLVPPAVERCKELRDLFKIPDNNEVVASMILGFPKYQFQRGIRRDLKSVTWL